VRPPNCRAAGIAAEAGAAYGFSFGEGITMPPILTGGA
jgi:hypothetical protein